MKNNSQIKMKGGKGVMGKLVMMGAMKKSALKKFHSSKGKMY